MSDDTIIQFGDAIKALGNGKVGGYLVRFTDASQPDVDGEFFDKTTDFDIEDGDRITYYYNHGFDPTLKRRKLGTGKIGIDDVGVWTEGQLLLRDEYERNIYAMIEAGKMGWSSGSLPHLVEYETVGKSVRIKSWPLGKDGTITPTPAAGLVATKVLPLKTWADWQVKGASMGATKAIDLQERVRLVADGIDRKYNAVREMPPGGATPYYWTEYVYDDYAIIRQDSQRWKMPYTITDGAVTFGTASKVEMDWIAAKGMLAHFDKVAPGQPDNIATKRAETAAPEAGSAPAATVDAPEPTTAAQEETEMNNDTDLAGILDAIKAQGDAIAGLTKKLENEPPVKTAGVAVVEDETDKHARGNPFKTFGEFLMAVKDANRGDIDRRLLPIRSGDPMDERGYNIAGAMGPGFVGSVTAAKAIKAAPTGIGESIPQAGGFLVGSDRNNAILSRVYDSSQLLSRIAMDPVGPNSNGMTYFAEAESSRATGSRRGGVRFYWMAENSAVTTSAPTFREMELKLKKAAAAVYVTEEQLADTAALESYVMRIMPEEIRFGVEDSILNGNGTGQPLGILNAPCLVTVAKEVNQQTATITSTNIVKMWARLWSRSAANAVWIVNQDVFPQLFQLSMAVGTGGVALFVPPGGISASPYGSLFGRPVIVHESAATLGTVGDIVLADMREYQGIEKGGIQSASSIHVRFLEGESVYRFIYRVDGQPGWQSALTPFKGTNTVSPFIALATRA